MSGLRLYIHDRHGRMIAGDLRVRRANRAHVCDGYRCDQRGIFAGEPYAIATMYPSDEDYNYVRRDRPWERLNTAVRMKLCVPCLSDDARDLLEVESVGSNVTDRENGSER